MGDWYERDDSSGSIGWLYDYYCDSALLMMGGFYDFTLLITDYYYYYELELSKFCSLAPWDITVGKIIPFSLALRSKCFRSMA